MELLNKIQKELKVGKTLYNKFGGYSYRSAEQILEAVKPLLGKGILTLSDEIVMLACEGQVIHEFIDKQGNVTAKQIIPATRFYVKATATLKDGGDTVSVSAYAREAETRKGMDDAQVTGACSSYARKYALNGLFGLSDVQDADDMDNRGTGNPPPQNKAKQEAQKAQQELGNHFDKTAMKPPEPTPEQNQVLKFLAEYWFSQIKTPNVKLDKDKILSQIWQKLGHYPTLDECTKLKEPESPFYIKLEDITKVVT